MFDTISLLEEISMGEAGEMFGTKVRMRIRAQIPVFETEDGVAVVIQGGAVAGGGRACTLQNLAWKRGQAVHGRLASLCI